MSPGDSPAPSRLAFRLPLLVWMGVILAVSSIPGPTLQMVGFSVADSFSHGFEYAILGFLAYRLFRAEGKSRGRAWLSSVLLAALMGAVDENYQRLIPERISSWSDWAADITGGGIGGAVAIVYYVLTDRFHGGVGTEDPSGRSPAGGDS